MRGESDDGEIFRWSTISATRIWQRISFCAEKWTSAAPCPSLSSLALRGEPHQPTPWSLPSPPPPRSLPSPAFPRPLRRHCQPPLSSLPLSPQFIFQPRHYASICSPPLFLLLLFPPIPAATSNPFQDQSVTIQSPPPPLSQSQGPAAARRIRHRVGRHAGRRRVTIGHAHSTNLSSPNP